MPEPTEREMVHALLACEVLIQECGTDRLHALISRDRKAERVAYKEQQQHVRRRAYWRNRLRNKPLQVVMEEWT